MYLFEKIYMHIVNIHMIHVIKQYIYIHTHTQFHLSLKQRRFFQEVLTRFGWVSGEAPILFMLHGCGAG